MFHLQQTWLLFLLLIKNPSKSQHVHYRPEVFSCDHCYTFCVEGIFLSACWRMGFGYFSSRKWGGSAWDMSYWVGNFTCSSTMKFSFLDLMVPRPQNSQIVCIPACIFIRTKCRDQQKGIYCSLPWKYYSACRRKMLWNFSLSWNFGWSGNCSLFSSTSVWIEL